MLKEWHRAAMEEVAKKGGTEQFIEEPCFIPLYRKHLIAGGLMQEDDAWFRDLWLDYCRNVHVWGTKPIEWRGGCHRSVPEVLMKGLAAKWYPDAPEAAHWKRYAELGFGDFWKNKELQQNDTGYFPGPIFMLLTCGDQCLGDDRAVTDAGMQRLWKRQMVEVTPDGAVNPYGPNGGWNSTTGFRLFALELVAAKTRNGEYRYAAHKVMNCLRYQAKPIQGDIFLREREVGQHVALAWLFADDSVEAVIQWRIPVAARRTMIGRQTVFLRQVLDPSGARITGRCLAEALAENVERSELGEVDALRISAALRAKDGGWGRN